MKLVTNLCAYYICLSFAPVAPPTHRWCSINLIYDKAVWFAVVCQYCLHLSGRFNVVPKHLRTSIITEVWGVCGVDGMGGYVCVHYVYVYVRICVYAYVCMHACVYVGMMNVVIHVSSSIWYQISLHVHVQCKAGTVTANMYIPGTIISYPV